MWWLTGDALCTAVRATCLRPHELEMCEEFFERSTHDTLPCNASPFDHYSARPFHIKAMFINIIVISSVLHCSNERNNGLRSQCFVCRIVDRRFGFGRSTAPAAAAAAAAGCSGKEQQWWQRKLPVHVRIAPKWIQWSVCAVPVEGFRSGNTIFQTTQWFNSNSFISLSWLDTNWTTSKSSQKPENWRLSAKRQWLLCPVNTRSSHLTARLTGSPTLPTRTVSTQSSDSDLAALGRARMPSVQVCRNLSSANRDPVNADGCGVPPHIIIFIVHALNSKHIFCFSQKCCSE